MDKLRAMQLFVHLADLGSFTRVAEQVGVSKSMISKEVSRLETTLGGRLLHRSTRNLKLTHLGEGYLIRAREILSKIEDADTYVQDTQQGLHGKLKINLPMALGITDLSHFFAEFIKDNPNIELDIHLGDENIDLIERGFDLGFRASSKPVDSNYIGKPLINFSYKICASPDYIASHAKINHSKDIQQHNCFIYSYFQGRNHWPIDDGVTVNGNLRVNNTIFMMESIKQGLGLGMIPDFVCQQAIDNGDVIEVLSGSVKPTLTLYALYPARHFVPSKLKQCIQSLESYFLNKS